MAIKHLSSVVSEIDPKRATQLLEFRNENYQRAVNPTHVKRLASLMNAHLYQTGHVVIANSPVGKWLANGQHSLMAIVESAKAQRCLVEKYDVKGDADYMRLFSAFDTDGRKRSISDQAKAFLISNVLDGGPSPRVLKSFKAGSEWLQKHILRETPALTSIGRFDDVLRHDYALAVVCHLDEISTDRALLLKRAPIMGAVIATVEHGKQVAEDFWESVQTGMFPEGTNRKDPRYMLHQALRACQVIVARGRGGKTNMTAATSGVWTAMDLYCACINAFNAHSGGKLVTRLRGQYGTTVPVIKIPEAA